MTREQRLARIRRQAEVVRSFQARTDEMRAVLVEEFKAARADKAAGLTLADIGKAAGVTRARIHALTRVSTRRPRR